jgi:uncharacterized membrane protein required for colicin V production
MEPMKKHLFELSRKIAVMTGASRGSIKELTDEWGVMASRRIAWRPGDSASSKMPRCLKTPNAANTSPIAFL